MSTDFVDSHDRHLVDANQLFSSGRFANADQLYGFSVECGLKSLMKAFGMPFDNVRQMPQKVLMQYTLIKFGIDSRAIARRIPVEQITS